MNLGPGHPSANEAKVILKNQNIITGQSDFDVKGKKSFFNLSPTQGQTWWQAMHKLPVPFETEKKKKKWTRPVLEWVTKNIEMGFSSSRGC